MVIIPICNFHSAAIGIWSDIEYISIVPFAVSGYVHGSNVSTSVSSGILSSDWVELSGWKYGEPPRFRAIIRCSNNGHKRQCLELVKHFIRKLILWRRWGDAMQVEYLVNITSGPSESKNEGSRTSQPDSQRKARCCCKIFQEKDWPNHRQQCKRPNLTCSLKRRQALESS